MNRNDLGTNFAIRDEDRVVLAEVVGLWTLM